MLRFGLTQFDCELLTEATEYQTKNRARSVVDAAATADDQHLSMLLVKKIVRRFNPRFTLSNPAIVSALSEKPSPELLADYGMKRLMVHRRCCEFLLGLAVEDANCAHHKLAFPQSN